MICARCSEPIDAAPCPTCGDKALLDGRYRLIRTLGTGAFGTTWLAERASDGLEVALKEIQVRPDAKLRELVDREASVLRQLHHPDIPRYIEAFTVVEGRARAFCLVQEYIAGPTLEAAMAERRFEPDEALGILERVLPVLNYLHGLSPPVIHRDLKPGNLILRPDARVALVDFGSVRDAFKGTLGGSTIAGTFGYMAPEQFHGDATPATDRYALGMIGIALVTGRHPASLLGPDRRPAWRAHARVLPAVADLLDELITANPAARPDQRAIVRRIAATRIPLGALPQSARRGRGATLDPRLQTAEATRPSPDPTFQPPVPAGASSTRVAVGSVAATGLIVAVLAPTAVLLMAAPLLLASIAGDVLANAPGTGPATPPPAGAPDSHALGLGFTIDADAGIQACFGDVGPARLRGVIMEGPTGTVFYGAPDSVATQPISACVEGRVKQLALPASSEVVASTWTIPRLQPAPPPTNPGMQQIGSWTGPTGRLTIDWPQSTRLILGTDADHLVAIDHAGSTLVGDIPPGYYGVNVGATEAGFWVVEGHDCDYRWTGTTWQGGCTPP
jgi:hypothetical protein